MKNSGKQDRKGGEMKGARDNDLDDELDTLFKLPLAEFTSARNTLAARLKKTGHGDEAVLVQALAKPSISAWTVNQLYWNHRGAFDRLIASGELFHKAQRSRLAGKVADMRGALDGRREALTHLSDLATSLLQDAGHNPTLDTIRRITATLEAMSAYASRSEAPVPGRLTHDIDPPGFESFGSLTPGAGITQSTAKPAGFKPSQKSSSLATNARRKAATDDDVRQLEETRKANIADARVSLRNAKRSLTEAQVKAQRLEAAQKKANAEAKEAEKQLAYAEKSLEKAKAASETAARRERSVAVEVKEAAGELEDARRTVERTTKELESLFQAGKR